MLTDIFLYAQNKEIHNLDSLLKQDKLETYSHYFSSIKKDTANYSREDKISLSFLQAKYYDRKGKTEIALDILKKLENQLEIKNDYLNLSKVNYEIFSLLKNQQSLTQIKESKLYLDKFYIFAKKSNDKEKLLQAFMAYAGLALKLKKPKEGLAYYKKAKKILLEKNDSLTLAKIYNNQGVIYIYFYKKNDSARFYYKKALNIYNKLNKTRKSFNTLVNISNTYKSENNYLEAIKWLKKADSIPITSYKINSKKISYKLMSKNYEQLADFKNANLYLNKYIAYKDSVDIKAQNIAISDIQTKYNTAQKEKKIIQLKAIKDQQKNYMIIGTVSFILLFLIAILVNYNLKRKKDIAEKTMQIEHHKIETLVKKQELITLDAIVIGQEKERKRIAEDLHDNLGSKLAVLKLHFDNFIDIANTNKNKKQIEKLITTSNLLEETYQTVRSMSHVENESKITQSLIHSIKSLANSITKSNKLKIEVIDFGLETPINHQIEIFSLRIVQELITNIIKYSKANTVSIDLTLFENLLVIIVSDNGVGFNSSKTKIKGIGLKTIKEKVENIKGSFTIDSGLGSGTTVIIELPINNKNI